MFHSTGPLVNYLIYLTIKLLMAVIISDHNKLSYLSMSVTFNPFQCMYPRLEPTQVEHPTGLHSKGVLQALLANIRLGCKSKVITQITSQGFLLSNSFYGCY